MRVWYPDELIEMIESHGFEITDRFGGYEGDRWREGSELVVVFRAGDARQPLRDERHDGIRFATTEVTRELAARVASVNPPQAASPEGAGNAGREL